MGRTQPPFNVDRKAADVLGVEIGFVADLESQDLVSQNALRCFCNLQPQVRGVVEGNTCSIVSFSARPKSKTL